MTETVLELRGVQAGYGRGEPALRDLSVSVRAAQVVCLFGPPGSGKSTVLKVVAGLLAPRTGSVLLSGEDVTGHSPQSMIGLGAAHVLSEPSLFPQLTVEENVLLGTRGRNPSGRESPDRRLLERRIEQVKEILPGVGERWRSISGLLSDSQQKQVELARALLLEPKVLLLDEPAGGLDDDTAGTLFRHITRIRKTGVAVLLAARETRSALYVADSGYVLHRGRVRLSGPARQLAENPRLETWYRHAVASREASHPGHLGGLVGPVHAPITERLGGSVREESPVPA